MRATLCVLTVLVVLSGVVHQWLLAERSETWFSPLDVKTVLLGPQWYRAEWCPWLGLLAVRLLAVPFVWYIMNMDLHIWLLKRSWSRELVDPSSADMSAVYSQWEKDDKRQEKRRNRQLKKDPSKSFSRLLSRTGSMDSGLVTESTVLVRKERLTHNKVKIIKVMQTCLMEYGVLVNTSERTLYSVIKGH